VILGARLLLLVVVLDCFLFFGMTAVGAPMSAQFGNQMGKLVDMDAAVNPDVEGYINYSGGGTIVQSSSLGWTSVGIDSIIGFVGMIFGIMTVPLNFMFWMGAPLFVQVVVGGTYIVLVLASIAQLITGRFA